VETESRQAGLRRWARKGHHSHRKPKATAPLLYSTEMVSVIEADMLHNHGRQHGYMRNGEDVAALSGSETGAWYQKGCVGTWEIQSTLRRGVVADNLKRGGSHEGALEVGPTHTSVVRLTLLYIWRFSSERN